MDISNITESQKAKLDELEVEFRKRVSEMPERPNTKENVLDNGHGRFTELWDWYKSEADKIVANG